MKRKYLWLLTIFFFLLFSFTACSTKTNLSIEEYAIRSMNWEDEARTFEPIESTRETILAKHVDLRSEPPVTFTLPVKLGTDILNVREKYPDNMVSVDVYRNDILEISVEAGVISPINNFRGLWLDDEHWFLEIAHVEEDPVDKNAAFIIWGEIIKDGESLNEKHGYDEAFDFQLLHGEPFFFFSRDGEFGFSYQGKEIALGYTEIPHYQCCSSAAYNPVPAENMVAFFASEGEQDYYVEIGPFE